MKSLFFGLLLAASLPACDKSGKAGFLKGGETKTVQAPAKAPDFNADSAFAFVQQQVAFGPRVPNTAAHQTCGEYLVNTLKNYGGHVLVQKFTAIAYNGTQLELRNIMGQFNPNAPKRILLAAHWDTRHLADKDSLNPQKPTDGANDGASGVAVLLEIARQLQAKPLTSEVGVDILFFDGEDYGQPDNSGLPYKENTWCLGAQYWSRNKMPQDYQAQYGILLDMVGAKNSKFGREEGSRGYANDVVEKVWSAAHQLGYSGYFPLQDSPGITDDHSYVNDWGNVRMIDIIAYDPTSPDGYFGPYHHRHADNLEIIDKTILKAVGQTVLYVVRSER